MSLMKNVNGNRIPMTPEEEAETRARWAEAEREQQERMKKEYMFKRRAEYPSVEDQLEMIYQDKMDGTNKWAEAITAIKQKYPKPDRTPE